LPGISLYSYNYKEVLSRRIVSPEDGVDLSGHGDMLWRMLLTSNVAGGGGEKKVVEGLSESPELIPVILRRARALAEKEAGAPGANAAAGEESISPEVLSRMFHHLGETLRELPEERKKASSIHGRRTKGHGRRPRGDCGRTGDIASRNLRAIPGDRLHG
jgi:hypothetical protein